MDLYWNMSVRSQDCASHRKCTLAYVCKIPVALGQNILLVVDFFVLNIITF